MYDDDKDALAAEYVLGTLSADERDQAEALLSLDPGFEAAVRQWERRLGELNVMVEAVEPPAKVWDKIKVGMGPGAFPSAKPSEGRAESGELTLPRVAELPRVEDASLQAPDQPHDLDEAADAAEEELPEENSPLAALEASLFPAEDETEPDAADEAEGLSDASPELRVEPRHVERSADVILLAGRLKRWRRIATGLGALAALLALYVAVWQAAPGLIPQQLRPAGGGTSTHTQTAGRAAQDRLVAVLQQDPTAPAFLVTLDTRNRSLIVRRVSATQEAGRSYELWLIAKQFPHPRSLGTVGDGEFTQRALPANYDIATLRTATYAVSLEPAGGSPSGVPTGPVLFTGSAVESLPGTPPT